LKKGKILIGILIILFVISGVIFYFKNGNLKNYVHGDLLKVLNFEVIPSEIKYGSLTIAGYDEISIKDEKKAKKYIKALNSIKVLDKIEEPYLGSPDTGTCIIFVLNDKEISLDINEVDGILIFEDDIFNISNYWQLLKLRD